MSFNNYKKLIKLKNLSFKPIEQVQNLYKINKKNKILIWCDLGKKGKKSSARIGKTFYDFYKKNGFEVEIVVGEYIKKPHLAQKEINQSVLNLKKGDLFISVGSGQAVYFHKKNKRIITRNLIEKQGFFMVATNGLISLQEKKLKNFFETFLVNFNEIKRIGNKIEKLMRKTQKVRITCPLGSDFELILDNKREIINNYGDICRDTNYPVGEVYTAPVEGSAKGVLCIKSSKVLGTTILHKKYKKYFVKNGLVVKTNFQKLNNALNELEKFNKNQEIKNYYKKVRNIAEFAIGTNKKAKFIGLMINDEKIFGTAHIAIGSNKHFGGKVACFGHSDHVIENPTIFFDEKKILENRKFLI